MEGRRDKVELRREDVNRFPISDAIITSHQDLHVNIGSTLHLSLYSPVQAKPHKSHDTTLGVYPQTHHLEASPNERYLFLARYSSPIRQPIEKKKLTFSFKIPCRFFSFLFPSSPSLSHGLPTLSPNAAKKAPTVETNGVSL